MSKPTHPPLNSIGKDPDQKPGYHLEWPLARHTMEKYNSISSLGGKMLDSVVTSTTGSRSESPVDLLMQSAMNMQPVPNQSRATD